MAFAVFASAALFSQGATCEEATAVAAGDYTDPGIAGSGASNICYGAGGTGASWYTYTAAADVAVVVSSNFDPDLTDTRLSIYTGTCDELTCVAQSDDEGEGFTSIASFNAITGTTYYIEWDDRWSADGFEWQLIEFTSTPDCAVQTFPADGAVDVFFDEANFSSVILTWDLPTGGDEFTNVVISGGTDPAALNGLATLDATATSFQWNFLTFSETYYWTVVPTALGGVSSAPCTMFSFTTGFLAGDSDGDGVLDVDDCAPDDILVYAGAICDDGDPATVNDLIQVDCTCVGIGGTSPGEACEIADEAFVGVNTCASVSNGVGGASNVCFGTGAIDAHWYFWEAPSDGLVTINSGIDPNLNDTRLSVYTGTCDALECFASSDDEGDGFTSIIVELVDSGTVYLIEWDDRWNGNGFDFEIVFLSATQDTDDDTIVDIDDNCPEIANTDQSDVDSDGIGDVCDDDIDGDGELNDVDCDPLDATVFVGAACDDGVPGTVNDTYDANCVCMGLVPSPGDICEIAEEAFIGINVCDTVGNGIAGASNVCFGTGGIDAHWYFWEAPSFGQVTINSGIDPNLNDTRLSVYTGTCDDLTCFASDDDNGDGFTSIIVELVDSGTVLLIEWDDRWNGNGFDFEIQFLDGSDDADLDGIVDLLDNCVDSANVDQADLDLDGIGDVCDDDIDGDGDLNDVDCDPLDASIFIGSVCDDGVPGTVNDMLGADCVCMGLVPGPGDICEIADEAFIGVNTCETVANGIGGASNNCFGAGAADAHWYFWEAPSDGQVTISSGIDPNLTDTRLSVYTGACDALECLASNDDVGANFTSLVVELVESGTVYLIEWDDRWTGTGFDFEIVFLSATQDTDEDTIFDIDDNCPEIANTDQADLDGDGIGDVCDDDIDGDFFLNDDDCDPMDATVFAGAICDDGDTETVNDIIQSDCICAGVIPPTNTECTESIVVTIGSYVDPGPFAGGNSSNICFGAGGTNSNWYEYTADGWGTVTVGSDLDPDLPDTRLSVYTGTCDELICFASSDDEGEGFTSVVSFPVENGMTYWIEWDDRWNQDSFDWYISMVTGIEDIEGTDAGVTVYPNPANDILNLTYTLDERAVVLYEIYNISGQMISTQSVAEGQGVVRQTLDVNSLSSGMYVLKILVDDQQVIKRFNIQK